VRENVKLSQEEVTLDTNLIEQMSGEFEDEYRIRLLAMLEEKSKGQEVTVTPAAEPASRPCHRSHAGIKRELGEIEASEKSHSRERKKRTVHNEAG
jgi:non-homologous end joining protein Ku